MRKGHFPKIFLQIMCQKKCPYHKIFYVKWCHEKVTKKLGNSASIVQKGIFLSLHPTEPTNDTIYVKHILLTNTNIIGRSLEKKIVPHNMLTLQTLSFLTSPLFFVVVSILRSSSPDRSPPWHFSHDFQYSNSLARICFCIRLFLFWFTSLSDHLAVFWGFF